MAECIRQLKIKTGSVTRMMKDLTYTSREIENQERRIQQYKDDPERDEHDVRKQEEVLGEIMAGRPDEMGRLKEFRDDLAAYLAQLQDDASFAGKDGDEWAAATEALKRAADALGE